MRKFLGAFLKPLLGLSMFQIDSHQVFASLITNRRFLTSTAANERVTFTTSILFISPSYSFKDKKDISLASLQHQLFSRYVDNEV